MATNSYISNTLNEIRERLLDKSKRNKLLNFRRNKSSLVIVGRQPEQVFKHLVLQGFQPLQAQGGSLARS